MTVPAAVLSGKARRTMGLREIHFSPQITSAAQPDRHRNCSSGRIEGAIVMVLGLDLLTRHTALDLKPDRGRFTPIAPSQPGHFQIGDP
jgi:hypothetical protein